MLFTECKEYYDAQIDAESKRLNRLNKAATLTENDEVSDCLQSLISEIKKRISELKDHKERLKALQNEFFAEMKRIGDIVNIEMPEPSEIDLIRDKAVDPKSVLDEYCSRNNIRHSKELEILIADIFSDIKPASSLVGSGFSEVLDKTVFDALNIGKENIKFDFGI